MSVLLLVHSEQYHVWCHARMYVGACRKCVCSHAVESEMGIVRLHSDVVLPGPTQTTVYIRRRPRSAYCIRKRKEYLRDA